MIVSKNVVVVARTLIGEARGQGLLDMLAVASVIRERVLRPGWWGTDWVSVCKKPWQFTCWMDHNLEVMLEADKRTPEIWHRAVAVADWAVNHMTDRDVADLFCTKGPFPCYYHDRSISYPERAWGAKRIVVPTPWESAFLFYTGIDGTPLRRS